MKTGVMLAPWPRQATFGDGVFRLPASGGISCAGVAPDMLPPVLLSLRRWLGAGWSVDANAPHAPICLSCLPQEGGAQAYRLRISPAGIMIEAQERAGFFYAAQTLGQLLRRAPEGELPCCAITDAPDFATRGVMLDISRDKVPTMETLFGLVDLLASLKINQFQLYTEHTFAYAGHEEVWRDASPLTPAQIRELDAYCHARCIELVPNQNSFGHLERWLTLPRYNGLAELPQGGAPLPWGGVQPKPAALCPTDPRSLGLLDDLYGQLLPNFSSTLFNVGCDETFDLRGPGRSAALVREVGEGRVYLDFLRQIHALVSSRGRQMAFWGDIIIRYPELVAELPRDAIALEWGYEADHPFDEHGAIFAASGVPFYVCPGTSSWNSLAGRTTNMRANQCAAARHGMRHGACGYLITDWGDHGHWQPLAVSLAGYLHGAALAWCRASNESIALAPGLDELCGAGGAGAALLELGDLYLECGALRGNATELFMILSKPSTRPVAEGVTLASLSKLCERLDGIEASIAGLVAGVVKEETAQTIRLMRAACQRGLALLGQSPAAEKVLAREELLRHQARVWLLRNRPGGLQDSLARFPA